MIKTFNELYEKETKNLFEFVKEHGDSHYFKTYQQMLSDYQGEIFNHGKSLFILFHEKDIIATIGVITKEVKVKREIFLTNFVVLKHNQEKAGLLIKKAEEFASYYHPKKIKIGLNQKYHYLEQSLLKKDYKFTFYSFKLTLSNPDILNELTYQERVEFKPLTTANQHIYQKINDEAFVTSPNGALLTDEGLKELVELNQLNNHDVFIGYIQNEPFGIFHVKIKDNNGFIETIGVMPQKQGEGLGKFLVKKAVDILHNVTPISLFTISSNFKAIRLYEKCGFLEKDIKSYWYEKEEEN